MIWHLLVVWPLTNYSPVVTSDDLIAAGDQLGCNAFRSATVPETTGVAMDVPE